MKKNVYRALTIAGSDSGGGAGIQADLKTFMAHKVYGASAITAVTVQNTLGVKDVFMVPPETVAAQIDAVLSDIGADAVKTGMLWSREIISCVAGLMKSYAVSSLVVDPVMVSTSGHRLLKEDAVSSYLSVLLPLALMVTPNLYEAEILSGMAITSPASLREAALRILDCGPGWVLIKGGHRQFGEDDGFVTDLLTDGSLFEEIRKPRINSTSTHGTGCTLSAAITAGLASGADVAGAVRSAVDYTARAIMAAHPIGGGHGPLNHNINTGRYSV
ncbi:MAG: bifunctional hydroxymethylpyrimidine kinase/phosphomethylpyrimidine kinase [Bacillota bacterium]